jgi:hypothetical protein
VTCLNVIGNRATVGFIGSNPLNDEQFPRLLFIEDNGPSGDVIGFGTMAPPYSKCPAATDASFVVPPAVPGLLMSGDFTVQAGTGT